MEEEKAAAYYDELLGKGRNAALFKQGLGFGSNSTNAPAAKYGMISFVGAGKSKEARKELDEPRPVSEPADRQVVELSEGCCSVTFFVYDVAAFILDGLRVRD